MSKINMPSFHVMQNRLGKKTFQFQQAIIELCNKTDFVRKGRKKLTNKHNKNFQFLIYCTRAWKESFVPAFYSPLIEIKLNIQNRQMKITVFAIQHPRILALSPHVFTTVYTHLLNILFFTLFGLKSHSCSRLQNLSWIIHILLSCHLIS